MGTRFTPETVSLSAGLGQHWGYNTVNTRGQVQLFKEVLKNLNLYFPASAATALSH